MADDEPMPLREADLAKIANPEWDKAGQVHDWRNHVSEEIQSLWETFNQPQKEALYRQARELASDERWEW